MHIAIISVAPPYRGGISKFCSILVEKISKKHLVKVINFKRQYPNLLFPGKSQFLDSTKILGELCIDSINPINWFNVGKKLSKGKFDLIIFNIWNPFFSPCLSVISLQIRRKSPNTKLISLCHNILPHEKTPFSNLLMEYLLNGMHGHIVLSNQTENELKEIIDNPNYIKCLHPIYDSYPSKINKNDAKKKLKVTSKNVILFFGLIRSYKGFDVLLKALSNLKKKKMDFHVLVAGECYEDKNKYIDLINELKINDLITWHDLYIPDSEVSTYFSASEVVVLPYKSASQSGIAQIAYNYDIPIIVSDVGGLPEIVNSGKTGYIFNSEDHAMLSQILYDNFLKNKFKEMGLFISNYKEKFSWKTFISGIENIYKKK